jgi:enoyl-CoA hydratase/carnithine racemase
VDAFRNAPEPIVPEPQVQPTLTAPAHSPLPPHPPYQLTSIHVFNRDGVLFLEFSAADKFPRLNRWALTQIRYYMSILEKDSNLRGAIITGTDKCFAAGAELAEVSVLTADQAFAFAKLGRATMKSIEKSPKPVIAAIRGYCMGGGLDLAMACHIRIATPDTALAHRGAALGLVTGWGGTQRMPRILGPRGKSITMEVMASGRFINAPEAYSLKLISKIVPAELLQQEALAYTNSQKR